MVNGIRMTALSSLMFLGGCDGGTPAAKVPAQVTTIRNDFHDRMLGLTELRRSAALRNAIRTSRESCDRVDASAFQQDHENLKMWVARCQRTDYAVFLAANGDVQVRKCPDLVALKLPACRALAAARPAKS